MVRRQCSEDDIVQMLDVSVEKFRAPGYFC